MKTGIVLTQGQRSDPRWQEFRFGRITGSRIGNLAKIQNVRRYKTPEQLVLDIFGLSKPFKGNVHTDYGVKNEPVAFACFAELLGPEHTVQECGLIQSAEYEWAASSPDGLVDEDAVLEIKCLSSKRNQPLVREPSFPNRYLAQCYWHMFCTGRPKCYLALWNNTVGKDPGKLQVYHLQFNKALFERHFLTPAKVFYSHYMQWFWRQALHPSLVAVINLMLGTGSMNQLQQLLAKTPQRHQPTTTKQLQRDPLFICDEKVEQFQEKAIRHLTMLNVSERHVSAFDYKFTSQHNDARPDNAMRDVTQKAPATVYNTESSDTMLCTAALPGQKRKLQQHKGRANKSHKVDTPSQGKLAFIRSMVD